MEWKCLFAIPAYILTVCDLVLGATTITSKSYGHLRQEIVSITHTKLNLAIQVIVGEL